ncbi:hypothetical protein P3L10_008931 [Capsicum annuum]
MNIIQTDPPDKLTQSIYANQSCSVDLSNSTTPTPMSYINALSQTVPSKEIDVTSPVFRTDTMEMDMSNEEETLVNLPTDNTIVLSAEDRARIHRPWSYSVIIKLTRRKVNHVYLRNRLSILWKPMEELILIDLGNDYFIVKFLKEENMQTALKKGPWFINGAFLSVRK